MSSKHLPDQYDVKRLSAENLTDLENLYTAVYEKQVAKGFYAKKYNTAFTGVEYTGFIAYSNSKPVAFYGAIPCFLKVNDEIILAAQAADAMTHPDHRNKGLFVELALTTLQLCRDLNIRLVFGFPNQNSSHGLISKLGWKVTDVMDCYIFNTGNLWWNRILNKLPVLKNITASYQKVVLKKYLVKQNGVNNSVFNDGYNGVYRDSDYFKYKTYNDTFTITAAGSILWIKISTILLIGDIAINPDNFDDMIYELKELANKLRVKQIHFHTSPGTTLYSLFAMRFNSISSFQVIFKVLGEDLPLDKIKFTSADIDTF